MRRKSESPRLFVAFRRDEAGTATVESLLWLLLLFFLVVLVVNASFIFYSRAQAMQILQDANRAFSTGRLQDEAATEAYLLTRLASLAPSVQVDTSLNGGIITSVAKLPITELVAVQAVNYFTSGDTYVQSQHLIEH